VNTRIQHFSGTFSTPADDTQYTIGDEVASSATAGSVVRAVFPLGGKRWFNVLRAYMSIVPAAGSLVITACDLALLVYKTDEVIAAIGDNKALVVPSTSRILAAKFNFVNGAWTQPTGAVTAGTSGYQEVLSAVGTRGNGFEFVGGETESVTAVVQAIATWNAGAQVQAFTIGLDIESPR